MNLRRLFLCIFIAATMIAAACTSAIISGACTTNGRPLLYKHRDTSNAYSRVAYIAAQSPSELAYVGLFNSNDPQNHQAWIGMNQAGFAIMNTASYNLLPKGEKSADREGYVMAMALKKCKTVDDFAAMLDSLTRPIGVEANFGVIDALGNGAFFETGNHSYTRFNLCDAQDGLMVRTNYSYSGHENEGSGYMRHDNAIHFLQPITQSHDLSPAFLTEIVSRSFYRDDEGYDFLENDSARIVADKDFIPRYTSVATIVIEGISPQASIPDSATVANQYIMWTGLGYPPCAEIRPVWCRPDGVHPDLQGQGPKNLAPLAQKAQSQRLDVFSTRSKEGKTRYVDLDKLNNIHGTGYSQIIIPRNLETYARYSHR